MSIAEDFNKDLASSRLGALADLLEAQGISIEEIGKIRSVGFVDGEYQSLIKNNEGEAEIHDLHKQSCSINFSPKWEEGPDWPVVQRAPESRWKARAPRPTPDTSEWKRAVIVPDIQTGFRRYEDGTLDPFHDEKAIDVMLQIVRDVDPHLVVFVGDNLDLPEFSQKFIQEPAFAQTTQPAVDRMHGILCQVRSNTREDTKIKYLEGNHDRRIHDFIINNAKAAFGLKKAKATPESWPVLSVPNLLRMDELDVEYISGYPAARYWINDRLMVIHGWRVKSNGSTAAQVVDDERVSVLFGHIQRIEEKYKTRHTRHGPKSVLAASMGTLARIDGAVPSTKGSTDVNGRAVEATEDWQQGIGVVEYVEGDGRFHYESVHIHEGWSRFRGKNFFASDVTVG